VIPTPDQIQAIVGTLEGFLTAPPKLATKEPIPSSMVPFPKAA
jgi:hypothetical protein